MDSKKKRICMALVAHVDSGKTTFIQETLEDPSFNGIEKTLVILCEEGEVELEPAKFANYNVDIITIEDE